MDRSNVLAQAADLIKAGQKQQAAILLNQLIHAEPENVRAWALMSETFSDPEKRRQCLEEVIRLGDLRMVAWAREKLDSLPAASAAPQMRSAPLPPPPPMSSAMPSAMQSDVPLPEAAPVGVSPLIFVGAAVLAVVCVLLVVILVLPAIQRAIVVSNRPGGQPLTAPTSTERPTRGPLPTSTASNTPLPTRTRVPRATATPTATETLVPSPTSTPSSAQLRVVAGNLQLKHNQYDAALSEYNQAITLDSKLIDAYIGRATVYLNKQDWSSAEADARSAIAIDSRNPAANALEGDLAYYKKDYTSALSIYTQLADKFPVSAVVYGHRGLAYFKLDQVEQAFVDLTHAIQLDVYYADAFNNRGMVNYKRKGYDAACPDYKHAIQLDPEVPLYFSNYANCLLWGVGDIENAALNAEKSVSLDSGFLPGHLVRGDVYYFQKKYSEALVEYNISEQLGGAGAVLYKQRGLTYSHLASYAGAVRDFTSELKLAGSSCALNNLCQAYNGLKNYAKAIENCTTSTELGGPINSWLNRAIAYDETGEKEKAVADYKYYLKYAVHGTEAADYAQERITALEAGQVSVVCAQPYVTSCGNASVVAAPVGDVASYPHALCDNALPVTP